MNEQLALQIFIDPANPNTFRIESKMSHVGLLSVLARAAEHIRCDLAVTQAVKVMAEAQQVKLASPADVVDQIDAYRKRPK